MNHSRSNTKRLYRLTHTPLISAIKPDDPLLLHRSCDITAACGRKSEGDDSAVMMHLHLSRTTPLWQCIAVGVAAIGVTAAVVGLCSAKRRFHLRRKYARHYAEQLKLQKLKQQLHARANDRACAAE